MNDNLEGPPPSDAERSANRREIAKLSRGERFALMFGCLHQIQKPMSQAITIPTRCPRCDHEFEATEPMPDDEIAVSREFLQSILDSLGGAIPEPEHADAVDGIFEKIKLLLKS